MSGDGSKQMVAVFNGYVYYSSNYGQTWTEKFNSNAYYWASLCSSNDFSKVFGGGSSTNIFRTTNYGDTFASSGTNYNNWASCAMSSSTSLIVYGGISYAPVKSTDGGVTWSTFGGGAYGAVGIVVSSDGTKIAMLAKENTNNKMVPQISTDSGASFTVGTLVKNWKKIAASSDLSKLVAITGDEYLYISTNGGTTWTAKLTDAARTWTGVCCSSDFTTIVAVADNDYIYVSRNSGTSFSAKGIGGWFMFPQGYTDSWTAVACSSNGQRFTATTRTDIYTSP